MDRADREIVKMQAAVIAAGMVQTHAAAPEVTARMSIQIANAINQQIDEAEPEPEPAPVQEQPSEPAVMRRVPPEPTADQTSAPSA